MRKRRNACVEARRALAIRYEITQERSHGGGALFPRCPTAALTCFLNELPEAPSLELARVISYGPQQLTEMSTVVVKGRVTSSPMAAHPVAEQHQDMRVLGGFLGGRHRQKPSAAKTVDKQTSTPLQIPPVGAAIALTAASREVAGELF